MKKVHYIGYYMDEKDEQDYIGNVPGRLKMRYIKNAIKRAGFDIVIYSLCEAKSTNLHKRGKCVVIDQHEMIHYIASFPPKNAVWKLLMHIYRLWQVVWYVLVEVKKDETLIVYHSYDVTRCLAFLKLFKRFRCIAEVEELYAYSAIEDKGFARQEIAALKKMDGFIFVNDLIPRKFKLARNFTVCYGVYALHEVETERKEDGIIHVVYAGTVESKKRGAMTAIEAADFLPDRYQMHILGFGHPDQLEIARKKIAAINQKAGKEKVVYHGMLSGQQLSDFLHGCHIGLSSNVMREAFVNNSFPSKVITYMCHNLAVVAGYGKSLEAASLSRDWTYFFEYHPAKVAEAITRVDSSLMHKNYRELIERCDEELVKWLKTNLR